MRVPDRFWWVEALLSLVASAGVIIAPVIYLSGQLPLDQELGYSYTNDLLLAAAAAGVFLLLALILIISAARSHIRYRKRKSALDGNLDALPLTRITLKPADAPDVSLQPLVLMWSASRRMRFFEGPLQVLLVIAQGAVPLLFLVVVGVAIVVDPQRIFTATLTQLLAVGGAICLGAIAIVLLIFYSRAVPTYFGRPFGVTATNEGIECCTQLGRRFFVSWAEIRLFEVVGSGGTVFGRRRFRVYGSRRIAEWHDNPFRYNEYAPHEMTPEEMASRLQAMVNLIAARTGLAPRTFSKTLRAPGESVPHRDARSGATGPVIRLLFISVFTLACAGAATLLPLTTSTALNLAVAGSLTALVVAFVVLRTYDRHLQRLHAQYVTSSALPPNSPTGKYTLRSGLDARARLILAFVGTALCVNFLPALAILINTDPAAVKLLPLWLPIVSSAAASVLSWLLFCAYGLNSVVLLLITFRAGATEIHASATGLNMKILNRPVTLLWEQVTTVTARTRQGRIIRYVVEDTDNRPIFSWPGEQAHILPLKLADDSFPVTPGELAALVWARSGKPIEMREM